MNIHDFQSMKNENRNISMITCYDYWSAKIVNQSNIDCILVGDSLSMVMHGADSTLSADVDLMSLHIQAVKKGAPNKFIVGDMPFMSYRKSLDHNMNAVETIMKAGSHAIKLEGVTGNEETIQHAVESGVPVMGHLGLTPQFINALGGFKVQGRSNEAQRQLLAQSKKLEQLGCFALVLEAIPSDLGKVITEELSIPTIGIGAGPDTSGQVLVMQDMLGMDDQFKPKFLRKFLNGHEMLLGAFNAYNQSVKEKTFPNENEVYQ